MSMAERHEYLRARFSRRRVIRGGAVTLDAVAGGAFVPGAVDPFGRHLAYGADPRTEMTVFWRVPVAVRKPFIRIGAHPWDLSRRIEAEVRTLHTPAGVGASRVRTATCGPAGPGEPGPSAPFPDRGRRSLRGV